MSACIQSNKTSRFNLLSGNTITDWMLNYLKGDVTRGSGSLKHPTLCTPGGCFDEFIISLCVMLVMHATSSEIACVCANLISSDTNRAETYKADEELMTYRICKGVGRGFRYSRDTGGPLLVGNRVCAHLHTYIYEK